VNFISFYRLDSYDLDFPASPGRFADCYSPREMEGLLRMLVFLQFPAVMPADGACSVVAATASLYTLRVRLYLYFFEPD